MRDYGFDYRAVRAHGGLAWFPRLDGEHLAWEKNPRYSVASPLVTKRPARYASLGLRSGVPIWTQYLEQPETIMWVPQPDRADAVWTGFTP